MRSESPKALRDECRGDSRDERKDESKDAAVRSGKKLAKVRPFGGRASVPAAQHIGRFLAIKELSRLSVASRDNHKALDAMVNSEKLLERVVKGQEKLVKMMLDANPRLLLANRAAVEDYSGKRIHGLTAFQAALCAGDVDMVEMMRPYFGKLDEGDHHLAEQIKAVFPDGCEEHNKKQRTDVFDFGPVCNAIKRASVEEIHDCYFVYQGLRYKEYVSSRDKPDEELSLVEALNRFREQFTKKSMGETIYNPRHLVIAMRIFRDGMLNKLGWGHEQNDLFHNQVLGFCERFVPACAAQKIAQGLPAEPFARSLIFQSEPFNYFPIKIAQWVDKLPCEEFPRPEQRESDKRMDGLGFDVAGLPNGRVSIGTLYYDANEIKKLTKQLGRHFKNKRERLQALISECVPSTPDDAVTATKK